MKKLEQLLVRGRARYRSVRAHLPGSGRSLRPVRLVLRLNDINLPPGLLRATDAPMALGAWQSAIVGFVQWLGPVRVCFSGGEPARSPLMPDLVRFANRLECPTHLVTTGPVDEQQALELVDRGLGAVTVLVGGLDEATHAAVTGGLLPEATQTLQAFVSARQQRSRALKILVGIPLHAENIGSVEPIAGWARQAGADGVLATLPLNADAPKGALEALDGLGLDDLTPHHLRTWLEGRRTALHGGLRAELISDGTLLVSPHIAPLGQVDSHTSPRTLWEAGGEQLHAVQDHPRPWDEVELVPQQLSSTR